MKFVVLICLLSLLTVSTQEYTVQHFEEVNTLTKDKDGNVYLIGEQSVCKFRGKENTDDCFFTDDTINHALISSEGEFYLVFRNKIVFYSGFLSVNELELDEIITDLSAFNNSLIIGTLGSGMYTYSLKDNTLHQHLEDQYINDINSVNNQLYALTDEALYMFDKDFTVKEIISLPDVPVQLEFDELNAPVILSNNGKITFFNSNHSIDKTFESREYKPKKIRCKDGYLYGYDDKHLLVWNEHDFRILKKGQYDDILIAQSAMISSAKNSIRVHNLLAKRYMMPKTFSIFAEGNKFWLGKEGRISLFYNGTIEKEILFPKALSNIYVASLVKKNDTIYAGTMGKGILMFNAISGDYLGNYNFDENSVSQQNTIQLHLEGDNLWIGYLNGLILTNINTNEVVHDYSDLLNNNYLYRFYARSKDEFFLCTTDAGLIHYNKGEVNSYLENSTVYGVTETNTGLYFSVEDNGIYKLNDTLTPLSNQYYTRSPNSFNLLAVNGNVLIANNYGLDVIDQGLKDISYLYFDNLNEANLNAHAIGDTKVLIAYDNGIIELDKNLLKTPFQPQLKLETPLLFNTPVDSLQHTFGYNDNAWTFNYAKTSILNPNEIYYKYRLNPLEKEWVTTTDERISYYNLPSGAYTFEVSGGGHRNFMPQNASRYSFTISKPIWENSIVWLLLLVLLVASIFLFVRYREKQIKEKEAIKNIQLEYEYQRLKDQIDPHFLFNSFNSLIGIVEENPKKGTKVLQQLSDLYRSILKYEKSDVIPLADELELLTKYFQIHKLRFQDLICLHVSKLKDSGDKFVIPFSLQLLVENAIKHNVINSKHKLDIFVYEEKGFLIVKNKLNPKKTQNSLGLGLENLIKRHEMRLNKVPIIEKNDTEFIVKIPIINA